ncbi:YbhB/YbcL family Raf kinase inhibitor-like protein [Candidatus Dependentiae bacterium]|nr:YbhB/YbcL family Raf kinase inhibitor-like protein [Candidatus Dependentiae bacterium]
MGTRELRVTSTAFKEGGSIPQEYTCHGEDISPPLQWENEPEETKSFALICEDPDAPNGMWLHWTVYNIPKDVKNFSAKMDINKIGAQQGFNSWKRADYGGPCPPTGSHRYYFRVYALDTFLNVKEKMTRDRFYNEVKKHTLAEGQLMGRYHKRNKVNK